MEEPINIDFNNELCNSIKSKSCKNLQCTHKKKAGELFCGIHLKSGNIELFKPIINDNEKIDEYKLVLNVDNVIIDNLKTDDIQQSIFGDNLKESTIIDKNTVYTKEEFFNLFITNKYSSISIFTLRNNIKLLGLNKYIHTKQSKPLLINDIIKLIQKERYYENNYNKIVCTQSIVRKWLVKRRYICCNSVEITSFDDIFDIKAYSSDHTD